MQAKLIKLLRCFEYRNLGKLKQSLSFYDIYGKNITQGKCVLNFEGPQSKNSFDRGNGAEPLHCNHCLVK